ncbi:MAG TPA: AgmX/PglI C-terminal domain-containing protein [Polyangiaceae bacterium]|nr:AgmX/PglI C-terminal domain-containing protein [Polyangiaceae bacterium]
MDIAIRLLMTTSSPSPMPPSSVMRAGARIFFSYSRDQARQVEEVAVKLRARGHAVFFDRSSLGSEDFDTRIRREVQSCSFFVFFVSHSSVKVQAYARTELAYAETRWPNPNGRVIAVRADDVALDTVPTYLRALTTIRSVEGNFAVGAANIIDATVRATPNSAELDPPSAKRPIDENVAACSARLVDALSRRRSLPQTGTATAEVTEEIDEYVRTIKTQFKAEEGSIVAGARLLKVLGVGNFGTVWEAEDLWSRDRVAVKVFRLERLAEGQMLFRFRKSIRAMRLLGEEKRLDKSPEARGTVVAFGRPDASELAFSMELLTKGNLDDIGKRSWTLEHKLDICTRICVAVAYSHANGVVHRDIKPANIVLNEDGHAVLTDFDIADIKFATSMSTTVEGGLGTPVFAAPEQLIDADSADERSDVYSLGRLLYYMLLERSPGYQIERDPALENLAGFPSALVEIVRKATQHDPKRRFSSVDELYVALSKSRTGAAAWLARSARLRRWVRHQWTLVVIVGLIVGGSLGAVAYQARVAAREAQVAAREAALSATLSRLSEILNQSIRDKDAAVDRVTKIKAELELLHKGAETPDRDRLISEASTRLLAAERAVDDLTKQQQELGTQIEAAKEDARAQTSHPPEKGAHSTSFRQAPASIRVRMGATTVSGRLPPEVIQRIVRLNFGVFRGCYEQGLARNPNLEGRVSARFVIGRDGAVSNASNGGSDLPDSGVVSCVVSAFYGLKFPEPEGGIVTVVYPILLTPG